MLLKDGTQASHCGNKDLLVGHCILDLGEVLLAYVLYLYVLLLICALVGTSWSRATS